jgi:hypothetical protein
MGIRFALHNANLWKMEMGEKDVKTQSYGSEML